MYEGESNGRDLILNYQIFVKQMTLTLDEGQQVFVQCISEHRTAIEAASSRFVM